MKKNTIYSLIASLYLLFLSSCGLFLQPNMPSEPSLNFKEPDTVKSFVSFVLNSPLRPLYSWKLQTPADTFSIGAITSAGVIMRPYLWRTGGIIFTHFTKSNVCSFHCSLSSDLLTEDFIRPDNTLDALRSWRTAELDILFDVSSTIQAPLRIDNTISDSTFSIAFSDKRYQERFVYGTTPTSWSILSFILDIFADVQYRPRYLRSIDTTFYDPVSLYRYRTRLERAELYLDRYDTVRQRVDGRFSFRMVGYDNTIVEVKDGRFTNVRLNRTRD